MPTQPSFNQITTLLKRLPEIQRKYNIFTHYITQPPPQPTSTSKNGPLSNTVCAIKDNISTRDMPTTCASNILSNYTSPYDATIVSLLKEAGTTIIGKTNLDEFAMGSLGIHSNIGPVRNPLDPTRVTGGSSSGSAAAVCSGVVDFAIGTDTGGSVRLPGAFGGVVGFKPSYGRISRFGVIAFAQSLDTVGILGRDVGIVKRVFEILDKYDERDPTSLSEDLRAQIEEIQRCNDNNGSINDSPLRIGIPLEFCQSSLNPEIKKLFIEFLARCNGNTLKRKCEFYPVSIPSIKNSLPIYYTLVPSEAASNLARYDGIRYGTRDTSFNDITKENTFFQHTRANFGQEVKNRIILGNYNLCAEGYRDNFIKAQKLRVELIDDFDKLFRFPNVLTDAKPPNLTNGLDLIVCPTNKDFPKKLSEVVNTNGDTVVEKDDNPLDEYINDIFTIPMSLAGLPTISIPLKEGVPCGVQIAGQYGNDKLVLEFAEVVMPSGKCL